MKKVFCLIVVMFCFIIRVNAEDLNLAQNAKSAILMEASTGEIIFEKNSHEKLHPASMTKMMSMLLILENVEKGIISWDEMVTASENASSMGGSQILLEVGEEMSVDDLFKGIAVASGNDAVVAMAEKIAGTVDGFVDMMNKRASELGLQDTVFKNPHGLNADGHYSSAYDMALIARELVKHPKVLEYTSIYEDYLRKNTDKKLWLVNTNKLVRFYKGVDGLKTGYTEEAGYCLTSTANKGFRVITVVMGEPTSELRNKETSEMLDYAYAQYKVNNVVNKDQILGKIEVDRGTNKYVEIVPINDVSILSKKVDGDKEYTYDIEVNNIKAPVNIGDTVGTIHLKENGTTVKEIALTVNKEVKKANIIELY